MVASSKARDVLVGSHTAHRKSCLQGQTAALTYSVSANLPLTCSSLLPPHPPEYFHLDAHFHDLQRWRVSIKYEHDYINLKVAWSIAQNQTQPECALGPALGMQEGAWDETGALESCPFSPPFPLIPSMCSLAALLEVLGLISV